MNETLDRLLSAYLDGTLSPARRAAVEKRLAEPRVAKRLAQLRRLDEAVRASAVQPSAVQSRRMWQAIAAQVQAQAPASEPWYAFLQKRWFSAPWAYGLAGATAALAVVFLAWPVLQGQGPEPAAIASVDAEQPMAAAAATAGGAIHSPGEARAAAEAKAEAYAAAPAAKRAAAAPRPAGRSEVERALAEDPVDGLIERFLAEQPQALAAAPELAPSRSRRSALAPAASTAVSAEAGLSIADEAFDSSQLLQAQGGVDRNGFWDWRAAGSALNQRDWQRARVELLAAQGQAREASERAFAASALTLLAAAGQPLEGAQSGLPQAGELRVLSAGVWQLQIDSRLARFSRGFSARLPGFRVEGDSLLLDMTFDRGSFAAGTRFTRVSGEAPAKVFDAAAQPVAASDFLAPSGAVYHVNERELHLR